MPPLPLQAAVGRWSDAQIHDTIAAIARDPRFATPLRQSLAGRLFRFLLEEVRDLFELIRGSRDMRVVVVAAVVVIVAVTVARIVMVRRLDQEHARARRHRAMQSGRIDPWASANAHAEAGEYAAACHALYAAVVDTLAHGGQLASHSSKTSGDYARELRRRGSPVSHDFAAFARACERAIYGTAAVSANDYASVTKLAERAARVRAAA